MQIETLYHHHIDERHGQIERAEKEISQNVANAEECREKFAANQEKISQDAELLKTLTEKAEVLSKRLMALGEKIAVGEEAAQASRKKIIESIESLSDFNLSKGAVSAEKENFIAPVNAFLRRSIFPVSFPSR